VATTGAQPKPHVWFDRVISDALLGVLQGDVGRSLRAIRDAEPHLFDVQLRADRPKGGNSWATLYYGLTSLVNVYEKHDRFRLTAHTRHKQNGGFDEAWSTWMGADELVTVWPSVKSYIQRARPLVNPKHFTLEGGLHALLASGASDAFRVVNREASPSFSNQATKDRLRTELWTPIARALRASGRTEAWWPNQMTVGNSLDFLAADVGGRLALIEAKHHSATGMIAKVAAQVGSYARLYAYLLQEDRRNGLHRIDRMLEQRSRLGLSRRGVLYVNEPLRLAPVVAIGPEAPSATARQRLWEVAAVLDGLPLPRHPSPTGGPLTIEPLEVWYVNAAGRVEDIERAGDIRGRHR
jgi:hypothetical protein